MALEIGEGVGEAGRNGLAVCTEDYSALVTYRHTSPSTNPLGNYPSNPLLSAAISTQLSLLAGDPHLDVTCR